jgi:NitT/TauT family transport system permease protein
MAADIRHLRRPTDTQAQVAGLDALETPIGGRESIVRRIWASTWPKVLAVAIVLLLWQAVVMTGWRPTYVLPGPGEVLTRLWADLQTVTLWQAIGITMRRGLWGFGLAVVIGVGLGTLVSRFAILRAALGSLITGLQTMPSIAWFPLAILLFKLSEEAITFVVVLGAAPSIANGLIHGIDHIPPVLTRAGRVMGARGLDAYRHIIIPAALVRGRPQGRLGVRLALAHGRRADRGDRLPGVAWPAPPGQPGAVRRRRAAGGDDRDPGDRHPGRCARVRAG